jgi:hypothetical protein
VRLSVRSCDQFSSIHSHAFLLLVAETYRGPFYYFELVALLRRVLLVALSVLISHDAQLKAQLVAVLCCLLFLLQIMLRPYALARINAQESLCLFALCVIAALADHTSFDHRMSTGVQLAVSALVFAVTGVLAWSWALEQQGRAGGKDSLRALCCYERCVRYFPALSELRHDGGGSSGAGSRTVSAASAAASAADDFDASGSVNRDTSVRMQTVDSSRRSKAARDDLWQPLLE